MTTVPNIVPESPFVSPHTIPKRTPYCTNKIKGRISFERRMNDSKPIEREREKN